MTAARTPVEMARRALILWLRRADRTLTMNPRTETIKQLVDQSSYPIDEAAIAEAIIVRSMARRTVPDIAFHRPPPKPKVRSFRPHRGQSFRLARPERHAPHRQMSLVPRIGSPATR